MTKKTLTKIAALTLIAVPVLTAVTPHVASADGVLGLLSGDTGSFFSGIFEGIFQIATFFFSICGIMLNGLMVANLNIKVIVDSTPAIAIAWRTIRDFSSIFIIFMLLYASIRMILGAKGRGLADIIKSVVIAGLLINFSLFGTKLIIDASNIISTSFYCAMAPQSTSVCGGSATEATIASSFESSGLANIFAQGLDPQGSILSGANLIKASNTEWTIALSYAGGAVLMFFAGASFLTVAIMLAIRIGVLILLLAFSPIFCIAIMFPGTDIATYGKKWWGTLYSLCLFVPVYLFLMYISASIINDPNFFNFTKVPTSAAIVTPVSVFLQYTIAFIMINAPLIAAVSIAGEGAVGINAMTNSIKKWGQGAIKGGAGFMAQETAGRYAAQQREKPWMKELIRRNPNLAAIVDSGFGKISGGALLGGKGGFDKKVKDKTKTLTELSKRAGVSDASKKEHEDEINKMKFDRFTRNTAININQRKIDQSTNELEKQQLREANEKIRKERDTYDKSIAEAESFEGKKAALNKKTLEEFAKNVSSGNFSVTQSGHKAAKEAADKIRKDMKKSDKDKLLETLTDAMKPGGGEEKEGGAKK